MTTIFQPILHHTLVYIDDLLLSSGTHDEHHKLLQQFFQIIQEHGIMISDKKSTIATLSVWRCYTRAMIAELSFGLVVRMLGFPADILGARE